MSGVFISGVEMPKNAEGCEVIIRIQPNGEVLDLHGFHIGATALHVPDHGRLIDAAYIEAENDRRFDFACATEEIAEHEYAYAYHVVASILATAPTIIPADKGGDEE